MRVHDVLLIALVIVGIGFLAAGVGLFGYCPVGASTFGCGRLHAT
jgi:hypothetical protein